MKNIPYSAVWEITMGCNMRCKHCGSSCEQALLGELTTEQALKLCDDLGELGLKFITLSGGEPTTRSDWHLIAKRLRANNIIPNIITNGWLINEKLLAKAREAKIGTMSLSIDGLRETHDFIRREGAFDKCIAALKLMNENNIYSSVITTVNKMNINELSEMKEIFIDAGVKKWQLQFGLPMGNLKSNSHLVISPNDIEKIIDFTYDSISDKRMITYLADNIGYYSKKDLAVRQNSSITGNNCIWSGCGAGKTSMGILHNGDIVGCTAVRNKDFIEGNILEKPISEIWNDPNSFKWNREIKKEKLTGLCHDCTYGDVCLGGCANTRLCVTGSVYGENKYCSYSLAIGKIKDKINKMNNPDELFKNAKEAVEKNQFQIGSLLIERALELDSNNIDYLYLSGYANYMLTNYSKSKSINEYILNIKNEDVYALKGLGLSLSKLGNLDEGLKKLRKSMDLTSDSFMDPYYDCALIMYENNMIDEAKEVVIEAQNKFSSFYDTYSEFCNRLQL